LLPKIQDAIPTFSPSNSRGYTRWIGGEIQDASLLDMIIGYLMRHDSPVLNRYPSAP
jgi:hypothetical protein